MKIKNKMEQGLFMFFLIALLGGCKKDSVESCVEHTKTPCEQDSTKTNIRIRNNSKYDFCNVTINPLNEVTNYGIIKSAETTCYTYFDTAYNYAYVILYINNEEYVLQPIDYVGEQELGVGNFTYSIDVTDSINKILSITTTKD